MKFYTLLFSILIFTGCSNSALEQELADVKEKLVQAEQALAEVVDEEEDKSLVHVVYFKLKPDADQEKLIKAIHGIKAIDVIQDLEIGTFEDLGDQRALSEYQMMMSMEFKNEEDYDTYQAHELHLALKAIAKDMMAGPPATYDYMEK